MEILNRLQVEKEQERQLMVEKREQEKAYLMKMMQENEVAKRKQLNDQEKERIDDVKAQEAYSKMLEKQEADRAREF